MTHAWPVGRPSSILITMANFMKIIFIQLTNEARKVAMLEMFWKDVFRKFLVLRIALLVAAYNETNDSTTKDIGEGIIMINITKKETVLTITYLQHNKAVSFISPPHYALI
jgi:hypothetical protein